MLHKFVREYHWISLTIGILGNACFLTGSILFFGGNQDLGTIYFIAASTGMLLGRIGDAFVQYKWRVRRVGRDDEEEQ